MPAFINNSVEYYHTHIAPYLHNRVLVICAVIILLLLLVAVGALRRRSRPIRVFKTTSGRVQVTRSAIRDLVIGACRYVRAAHKPKVHIKARRGRLFIRIELNLNEDQRLNEVAVQLQNRIEDVLQNTLNLDRRSVRIDIGLKRIRHTKAAPPEEEPEQTTALVGPTPDVAPVKDDGSLRDAQNDPEPDEVDVSDDAELVTTESKPKRGFFGFGRKKAESDAEEDTDVTEKAYDADSDPFAPTPDEDKKKL